MTFTPQQIKDIALAALSADDADVSQPNRKRDFVAIRQVIILLLHDHFPSMNCAKVGQLIQRNRPTVIKQKRRAIQLLSVNDQILSDKYRIAKRAIEQLKEVSHET